MIATLCIAFLAFIVCGVPIAFAMLASTALALLTPDSMPMALIAQRVGAGIDNFTYLAIPLFVLAGAIMEHSGISTRLVAFARALVGHIRGGMGQVVIVSEIFFSGISGASLSDASAIGSIMFPALRRAGYKPGRAVALIAAACAMGILIPPCLTMVVLGALAGVSVGALFVAGFLPGLVMALGLMLLVYVQARRGKLPGGEPRATAGETWRAFRASIIPLMLPVIIFGGILGGVFSPTEAAAVAVFYAFAVAVLVYRELTAAKIYRILVDTATITGAIGLVLGAAAAFASLLAIEGIPDQVAKAVIGVSTNPIVFLVMANLLFILFGALLDGIPALLLFIPILMPISNQLGIDPLHFTLVSVASLGIGLIIPPIGIMLLVICSITGVPLGAVSRAMWPYLLILFLCLLLMIAFPWVVLVLPRAFGL
ncbi:MAG: TRAP transporter large permease [Burkholderiales bacterium]